MSIEISNWLDVSSSSLGSDSAAAAAKTATSKDQITKETFLQLLVAQIRHQDPLNPSDGVQFLTQLAQFSELEQLINMSQDLDAIRGGLDSAASGSGAEGGDTET